MPLVLGGISFQTIYEAFLQLVASYLLAIANASAQSDIIITTSTGSTNRFSLYLGLNAGNSDNNTANYNTFLGHYTGFKNTTGANNLFAGYGAGSNNTTGFNNTFIGSNAGNSTTTGWENVFTGYQAGSYNTTGNSNVFSGNFAGNYNTSGFSNVYIGYAAARLSGSGKHNVFVGKESGYSTGSGSYNTYVGSETGAYNQSGSRNLFAGYMAGYYNLASNNIFAGPYAGYKNTMGSGNIAIGDSTLSTNQTGYQNTVIGYRAGQSLTTTANTFLGYMTGSMVTSGSNNTFVGVQAGGNVTTGSNNIIIGPSSGTAITDGNDNVLMGYNSQAEDGLHNATAIGAGSRVAVSNALILGNQANVGIGTSAPTARLELVSNKPDDSGLRLSNLTTSSPTTARADQFLTVNQKGEVIKAHYQLRISDTSQWSDKVFSPTYSLRPLLAVASYIEQHGHLPSVPSAGEVVREGVDLVKMNALLLEKIEELTLYSIQQQREIERLKQQQTRIDQLERLVKQLADKK